MPPVKRRGTRVSDFGMKVYDMSLHDPSTSTISGSDDFDDDMLAGGFGRFVKRKEESFSLHECVRNNDITIVKRLLQSPDVDRLVNQADDSSQTPLHYAAKGNNLALCELLVRAGSSASQTDDEGATPLHYACRRKMLTHDIETTDVIRLLVRTCDYDYSAKDKYGSTALHIAAMRGNLVAAETLLKYNKTLVDITDQHGCTPLHEAATYSQVAVAELLIKYGSNIQAVDFDRCTPLHLACVDGCLDMVELLFRHSDPVNLSQLIEAKDKDDTSALHYAVESRNIAIIEVLTSKGAQVNGHCRWKASGCTALHLAAVTGDRAITEFLIEKGAKIEATDNRNCTPLHAAAQYDNRLVADTLLQYLKSNVNQMDVDGHTPLLIAVKYGSEEILQALLDVGADIDISDKYDKNALHLAVENIQDDALMILLSHIRGSSHEGLINEQDRNGQTPLHLAAQSGNLKIVEMLLDAGGDLTLKDETEETPFLQAAETGKDQVIKEMLIRNERVITDEDEFSNTALHKAAENGHEEVARTLVEWGAVREARNNRSWTPLDIAASAGHANIVKFLLNEDVSPNPQDKNKTTPLHLACMYGHVETVRSLVAGGADVAAVNVDGENCLDIAIANNHRGVIIAILKSRAWNVALANETQAEKGKNRITPLRKLFKRMPELASLALTQCIAEGADSTGGDYLEFNYDYIDDSYTNYKDLRSESNVQQLKNLALPDISRKLYSRDKNWIKENHPLSCLCSGDTKEHADVIGHPVVLALIRHKWMSIRVFYFLFMAFYATYVGMLTAYMVSADAPYMIANVTQCQATGLDYQSRFQLATMYIIWIMSGIGILLEVIQAISQGWLYFEFTNLVDWYTYISASVVVADLGGVCGLKTAWQWQMGSFTVLFSWLAMLLFLRRLPGLGIYVVMIVEIMKTFLKFFFVFFLFIVAFAMSYYILLQNQAPFSTPFYSITKTWVMMIGEMDYADIFHGNGLPYEAATFALFWLFLSFMAIIVMNLLTGLAVDDVNLLQQKAKIVKLRLQVELALAIELAMPEIWRRSTRSTVRRERLYRKSESNAFMRMMKNIQMAVEGPLLSRSAVIDAVNEMTESNEEEAQEQLNRLESRLSHHIGANRDQIMGLHRKLDQIEQLLRLQAMSRELSGGAVLEPDSEGGTPRPDSARGRRGGGRRRQTPGEGQSPRPISARTEPPPETARKPPPAQPSMKRKVSSIISGMSFSSSASSQQRGVSDQKEQPPVAMDDMGIRVSTIFSKPKSLTAVTEQDSQKLILIGSPVESDAEA